MGAINQVVVNRYFTTREKEAIIKKRKPLADAEPIQETPGVILGRQKLNPLVVAEKPVKTKKSKLKTK